MTHVLGIFPKKLKTGIFQNIYSSSTNIRENVIGEDVLQWMMG